MEFWKFIQEFLQTFGTAITSFFMGFIMAYFRTKKKLGKADWGVHPYCTIMIGMSAVYENLKIPIPRQVAKKTSRLIR